MTHGPLTPCLALAVVLLAVLVHDALGLTYLTHEDDPEDRSSEPDYISEDAEPDTPIPIVLARAATPKGPDDIAIVSWAIGRHVSAQRKLSERNHQHYAARHRYAFHNGSDLEAAALFHLIDPASWGKLYLVKSYLHRYAVVVWLDSDALVMNLGMGVEHWVDVMGEQSMLVTADWCQYLFNMGLAIFRRSQWTFDFLDRTLQASLDPETRHNGAWEQNTMNQFFRRNAVDRAHIAVYQDAHRLQAQLKWDEYMPGDWVVHNTWCPRRGLLINRHKVPARRSTNWDRADCDRLFTNYYCTAMPQDCPCHKPSNATRTWTVWTALFPADEHPYWLKEAFKDFCRRDIAAEINSTVGKEPHPICGTWCAGCLPGVKKTAWLTQDQILGPSWHRNRTLRYLAYEDDDTEYEMEDDLGYPTYPRGRYTLKDWNALRRRYRRRDDDDDLPYGWLFLYGALTACVFQMFWQYRKTTGAARVRHRPFALA